MNKSRLVLILIFLTTPFVFFRPVHAHPGNTDMYGCHTCYTNCTSWGLSYNEYHCHTPKYTTPSCPLYSTYDSLSGSCKCYSGYVYSGGRCISLDQSCKDQLGFSSRYNSLTDKCECSYGYLIDSYGKCSSGSSICWNKYGYNSKFNSFNNTCECNYGYVFNSAGTKCISDDEACQEQYGYGSKATISGNKCECKSGYQWEGNRCVLETIDIVPIVNTNPETIINTPKITKPSPTVKISPTPTTQTIESTPVLFTNDSINEPKQTILSRLWNFIKNLIGLDF